MIELTDFEENLKSYLEISKEKADKQLSKLRSNAEKKIRETDRRLTNVLEDSENFKEIITPDTKAMDKYSQKIYEVINDTINTIVKPNKITLKNLNEYIETTRVALIVQDGVLIKYVKLLKDSKYKRRVKSLDGSLKRLNKDLESLENFVKINYEPSASIETTSVQIDETLNLVSSYIDKYNILIDRESDVVSKNKEVDELTKELLELETHPKRKDYQESIENFENVQREIDHAFSNIRKVFRKYLKFVSKNRISTNSQLLSDLVTDAATTLATQPSTMSVISILKEVEKALEGASLNLNRDKKETARHDIKNFLDGTLKEFYLKAKSIYDKKIESIRFLQELDLDNRISQTINAIEATKRDRDRIFQREFRDVKNVYDTIHKNTIEINDKLSIILDKEVEIPLDLPNLPDWVVSA